MTSSDNESARSMTSDGTSSLESTRSEKKSHAIRRNGSSYLPKFLRRTMAHSTDPPVELMIDPEMVKEHKSCSAKVASALLTSMSPNQPNVDAKLESPNSKLRSFSCLRHARLWEV